MGVKNLWDILESCKRTLPLHHLQNKRVCIDLSCWMVQLHNVNKSHCSRKEKLYLRGLFHRLRALIALNCSIIFVSDGSIPALKISTYKRRLNPLTDIGKDDANSSKVSSLRRNMGSEFSCMIKEAKALGITLGIPCLDGIEEAEAQCALLNLEALCDGCFTSDSDVFLFGARTVYRDICLGEGGYVVCYDMEDIEKKLGFGRNSLIALALLLGSDYSHGVHGFGPESACQVIKSVGEDVILHHLASEGMSFLKKLRKSKKQAQASKSINKENSSNDIVDTEGNEQHLKRDSEFVQVINAYMNPKCHSADSEPVYRALALHPFQRTKLQQICARFFEWSPDKTDEYMLPKIAERDLRRFANLRSTSSVLGTLIPLDKMPIKCPASEIIKRRRVKGRECFEVLWENFAGLKTSTVPADLVDSACPERIAEFKERRTQKKNQRKPRQKEIKEKGPSMVDIDLKLHTLLLDIESDGKARWKPSLDSSRLALERRSTVTEVDFTNPNPPMNRDSENCIASNPTGCCSSDFTVVQEEEVIDLISPSPRVCAHKISKCQGSEKQVDPIDLSDSDIEMSPEHSRKARDLRLFLASIREEIS
ncbi:hypothetical protein Ancab_009622 [Ancistrocladus abbreviatus]